MDRLLLNQKEFSNKKQFNSAMSRIVGLSIAEFKDKGKKTSAGWRIGKYELRNAGQHLELFDYY